MSGNPYAMRRDTRRHAPPRPAPPARPPGVNPVHGHERALPRVWRNGARRSPPHAEGAPDADAVPGTTSSPGGKVNSTGRRAMWPRVLLAACLASVPAGAQVVHGRVVAVGGDSSVAAAAARVGLVPERGPDSAWAVADSLGRFTLRAADDGNYRLAASGPGLREAISPEFELQEGDSLEVVVRLAPDTVLLNPLQVVVASRRIPDRLDAFRRRAERSAFGWFITRDEIQRHPGVRTTDLLWMATGLRVTSGRGFGGVVRGRSGCIPGVYLDGMRIGAGAIDLWTTPGDLEGIEVYTGPGAPVEYGAGRDCAVVLLWTHG
jgi:hypothetical protein